MLEEKIFIKNKKGLKLAAVLHYPNKTKKYPAIILLHGFTGYKDEKHIEALANDLARNGFAAIRFDASGSGDSEGTIEKDYRFSNYLDDVKYVFNHLRSLKFVDKTRIGVWGHSMGGMIVIIFAAKNSKVKAVCSVCPPTKATETYWFKRILPEWKRTGWFKTKIGTKNVKIPYAVVNDRAKYNTLNFVGRVKQPVLIILGKADDTVPLDQTRAIFNKANKPKQLLEVDEMNHNYENNSKQLKLVNKNTVSFFQKYL